MKKKREKKKSSNLFWIILLVITNIVYLYQLRVTIAATDVVLLTVEEPNLEILYSSTVGYSILYVGIAYVIAFAVKYFIDKKSK